MNIRAVKLKDASKIAKLSGQLGYPITEQEAANHIHRIETDSDQKVFVAELGKDITGWIHIRKEILLVEPPFAEIAGLIVDAGHRKKNIGRWLVQESIQWARQNRLFKIKVRSNILRSESHSFYKALGFREVKTQKAYEWINE